MTGTYLIERLLSGDTRLALHCWLPAKPRAVLFYIHGVQSHGGWLFDTGPELSKRGVALYVLDRRGSGSSEGLRGDTPSSAQWLDDYFAGFSWVKQRHAGIPLTLVGQSMGGSVLSALVCARPVDVECLVLMAPALGRIHKRVSPDVIAKMKDSTSAELAPVELTDEQYTDQAQFLSFMRDDALMVRHVSARARRAMVELEEEYLSFAAAGRKWTFPSTLILPQHDPIMDNPRSKELYGQLTEERGVVLELPTNVHYLEFSSVRRRLWDVLVTIALTRAFSAT